MEQSNNQSTIGILHMQLIKLEAIERIQNPIKVSGFYVTQPASIHEVITKTEDPETLSMDVEFSNIQLWIQFVRNPIDSPVPAYYPCIADNSISRLVDHDKVMADVIRDLCKSLNESEGGRFMASKSIVSRDMDKWHVIQNVAKFSPVPKPELLILDEYNNPVAGFGNYGGIIEWCVFTSINQKEMEHIVTLKHEYVKNQKL